MEIQVTREDGHGMHAKLAPSSAERWIQCPASIRMEQGIVNESSVYAEEGTKAHALGEIVASYHLKKTSYEDYKENLDRWREEADLDYLTMEEMDEHIDGYVGFIMERKAQHPHSVVMLEQRVRTGIESCWGTADVIIVSPEHVEVIDLKYGAGVAVYAHKNPQLMLYGVGALDMYGDLLGETKTVRVTIYQPRKDSISSYDISASDLRFWRDSLIPTAELALGPDAHFGPSEKACRWCPAAGVCKARVEYMTRQDFGVDPDVISPEEMGEILQRTKDIKQWCSDVENAALRRLYSEGEEIPGWKVVMSGGKRSIADQEAALKRLIAAGYEQDKIARTTVRTLGDLEKIVGKKKLPEVLGDALKPAQGSPSLAREDDSRESTNPNNEAVKEFS